MEPGEAPISATTEERRRRAKAGVYSPYPFRVDGRRLPTCVACKNHGLVMLTRGHRARCPFRTCVCSQCSRHQAKNTKRLATKQAALSRSAQRHPTSPRHHTSPDSSCRERPLVPLAPRPPLCLKTRPSATVTASAVTVPTASVTTGSGSGGANAVRGVPTAGRIAATRTVPATAHPSATSTAHPSATSTAPSTTPVDGNNNSNRAGCWYRSLASKITPLPSVSPATPDGAERGVSSTVTSAEAGGPSDTSPPSPPPPPPGTPVTPARQRLDDVLAAVSRCESRAAAVARRVTETAGVRYRPYPAVGGVTPPRLGSGAAGGIGRTPLGVWPHPWAGDQSHWRAAAQQSYRSSFGSWSAQGAVWNQISYGLTPAGGGPGSSPPTATKFPTTETAPTPAPAHQGTARSVGNAPSGQSASAAAGRSGTTYGLERGVGLPADRPMGMVSDFDFRLGDGTSTVPDTSRNLYNWLSKQIDVEQRPGEEGALLRAPPRVPAPAAPPLRLMYVPSLQQTPFSQLFRQLAEQPLAAPPPPVSSPPHEVPYTGQLPPFCTLCTSSSETETAGGSPQTHAVTAAPGLAPGMAGWSEQTDPAAGSTGWTGDGRFPAVYDFDAVAAEESGTSPPSGAAWAGLGTGLGQAAPAVSHTEGLLQSPLQHPVSTDWSGDGAGELASASSLLSPLRPTDPTGWYGAAYQQYQQQQLAAQQQYLHYQQQLSQLAGWSAEPEPRWMTAGTGDQLWTAAAAELAEIPAAQDLSLGGAEMTGTGADLSGSTDSGVGLTANDSVLSAGTAVSGASYAPDGAAVNPAGSAGVSSGPVVGLLGDGYNAAGPAAPLSGPTGEQGQFQSTADQPVDVPEQPAGPKADFTAESAGEPDPVLVCEPVMSLPQAPDPAPGTEVESFNPAVTVEGPKNPDVVSAVEVGQSLCAAGGEGTGAELELAAAPQGSVQVLNPVTDQPLSGTAETGTEPMEENTEDGQLAASQTSEDGEELSKQATYPVMDIDKPLYAVDQATGESGLPGEVPRQETDDSQQVNDVTAMECDVPQQEFRVTDVAADGSEQATEQETGASQETDVTDKVSTQTTDIQENGETEPEVGSESSQDLNITTESTMNEDDTAQDNTVKLIRRDAQITPDQDLTSQTPYPGEEPAPHHAASPECGEDTTEPQTGRQTPEDAAVPTTDPQGQTMNSEDRDTHPGDSPPPVASETAVDPDEEE